MEIRKKGRDINEASLNNPRLLDEPVLKEQFHGPEVRHRSNVQAKNYASRGTHIELSRSSGINKLNYVAHALEQLASKLA